VKTLLYFEVVSTFALALGLIVGELAHPGSGFNIDAPRSIQKPFPLCDAGQDESLVAHLMAIIPDSFLARLRAATAAGFLVSILSGFAISLMEAWRGNRQCDRQAARCSLASSHHRAGRADRRVRRDGIHDRGYGLGSLVILAR